MLSNQTIDPNRVDEPKPFILWRPFVAVWQWMVPPTQAHKDRQSATARWVAGGIVASVSVAMIVLGFMYAKPAQDAYQDWRAEKLVREARSLAENGQVVNAIQKAQKAVSIAPDNIDAIRLNGEFLTYAKRSEAMHFLDRLEQKGVSTASDRQIRVRALMNLNRTKEASKVLEDLLATEAPTDGMMQLAEQVWGSSQRDSMLLRALKNYADKHPEDRTHSLRLAKVQTATDVPEEISDGLRRAWQLVDGNDEVGLAALELIDGFENLPPDESSRLIERLRSHPKTTAWHQVAALKRQLQLDPSRRSAIVQQAIEESRGKTREDLVPLVRWLVEQNEHLQVLALVSEQEAKNYQPLLENYLNALTQLRRFTDVERLVNDPKVNIMLNQSVSAFYKAHLAFVTKKPAEEVRSALILARNAADVERRAELLLKIGEYAEMRGFHDIAEQAYQSATMNPRTERISYQGLLRAAEANGNTEGLVKSANEATKRWPDDQTYQERSIYANLLAGREVENSLVRAQKLVEAQPKDHQRRLMLALAHWRLYDQRAAVDYLQNMEVSRLSPGQQAVFAAIARDSPANNAEEAARTVLKTIDPRARMLPEERALFVKAGR